MTIYYSNFSKGRTSEGAWAFMPLVENYAKETAIVFPLRFFWPPLSAVARLLQIFLFRFAVPILNFLGHVIHHWEGIFKTSMNLNNAWLRLDRSMEPNKTCVIRDWSKLVNTIGRSRYIFTQRINTFICILNVSLKSKEKWFSIQVLLVHHKSCCVNTIGRSWRTWKQNELLSTHDLICYIIGVRWPPSYDMAVLRSIIIQQFRTFTKTRDVVDCRI